MMNLIIFIKYFFKAKWRIKLPKKNKFVLVDGDYNPFLRYIRKKDFTILYRRGEEINFSILFKCLIKLKFSTLDYCVEFIKQVSPKLILTAFDYHIIFYKLSKKTGIKTLMIQKGARTNAYLPSNVNKNKNYFSKNSKKDFHVDYVLLFNGTVKKFYSNKINGKFFEIGSFENNFTKPNLKKQKKEIVFISNYSHDKKDKCENEDLVAFNLNELAKKNNINFNILPRYRKNPIIFTKEKSYYKRTLKNNFKFILDKNKSSYDIIQNFKFIFSTYSTLAIECLPKGLRVGFIMIKSKKNPVYNYRFGSFENLKKKGSFWKTLSKINKPEINRVYNFVTKSNQSLWIRKINIHKNKTMKFDYDNKTFKKIIKNL